MKKVFFSIIFLAFFVNVTLPALAKNNDVDSQKEKIDSAVRSSMLREPLVIEYNKGYLRVALPLGLVGPNEIYYGSIQNLCRNFAEQNLALDDVTVANAKGNRAMRVSYMKKLCRKIVDIPLEDAIPLIEENDSYMGNVRKNYWTTPEGKALQE